MSETNGKLPHQSEKNLAAAAENGRMSRPGRNKFTDEEAERRLAAVRSLRRSTPEAAEHVREILREMHRLATADPEATNMDKIAAARVVIAAAQAIFERGGVPAVTQLEVSSDQIQPILLVAGHHPRPGAQAEAVAEGRGETIQ